MRCCWPHTLTSASRCWAPRGPRCGAVARASLGNACFARRLGALLLATMEGGVAVIKAALTLPKPTAKCLCSAYFFHLSSVHPPAAHPSRRCGTCWRPFHTTTTTSTCTPMSRSCRCGHAVVTVSVPPFLHSLLLHLGLASVWPAPTQVKPASCRWHACNPCDTWEWVSRFPSHPSHQAGVQEDVGQLELPGTLRRGRRQVSLPGMGSRIVTPSPLNRQSRQNLLDDHQPLYARQQQVVHQA